MVELRVVPSVAVFRVAAAGEDYATARESLAAVFWQSRLEHHQPF